MPLSTDLAEKSVHAAISAIELYNKPHFLYREEAFALLMTNAWELLLKAKWVLDHNEEVESLYEYKETSNGAKTPKTNRSGNPISHGAVYLAAKLKEDKNSGLETACYDNFLGLIEIRDNAAHFINKDLYLGRRILEIGTASLRNYLSLAIDWFQLDLAKYNFFLMPISFYHGFETVEPATRAHYPEQIQRLLTYLDELEANPEENEAKQHVSLRMETKLVRGKDTSAVAFRWTDDPTAPAITVREEDLLKNYPLTYRELANSLKRRYEDFLENKEFHRLRKTLEKDTKWAIVRQLHPANPKSSRQRFYNTNILKEFDKHYQKRKKP
ncbi:MAG: DUF3644 domain-containing protein [Betaproteobacteria bacterium]|nr:DUF3644 domain-containing protein [Betaproteobacteria bacterium]